MRDAERSAVHLALWRRFRTIKGIVNGILSPTADGQRKRIIVESVLMAKCNLLC